MNFSTSLLFFCGLILSQIFSVAALPISSENGNNRLQKRKTPPFEFKYSYFYFKKPNDWANDVRAYIYSDEYKEEIWPGEKMDYNKNGFYFYAIENYHFIEKSEFKVIFSDGRNHQVPAAMEEGFPLRMDAVYDETGILGITNEKPEGVYFEGVDKLEYGNIARIFYRPKQGLFNDTIYIHYKIGNGEWNSIPGDEMLGMKNSYFHIDIDLHDAEDITYAFTDGKNWDNNNEKNYYHHKFDNFVINNGGRRYEPY